MCLAIPGKVKKIEGHKVTVEYPGQERQVMVGNDPIKVGDYVMVQMGIIMKILDPAEAVETKKAWKMD